MEGVTHWDGPPLEAWAAWTPAEITARLAGVDVPWCVVGGWAIDCFLGEQTREHEDLEIATHRPDLRVIRATLADHVFHVVGDGEVRLLQGDPPPERHQNWVCDPVAQEWRVDVMLEPGERDQWVCRRDESIVEPWSAMVTTTADGIPYLRPPGVFLYKAKYVREKDAADFDRCLPLLSSDERAWLVRRVAQIHPGHQWIERLG